MIAAGEWRVDADRSQVSFAIRHIMLSTLKGRFNAFEGTLAVAEDGAASAHGSVDAASIETGDPVRDQHLRDSSEFFDVERYPRISFSASEVELSAAGKLRIAGHLALRGVSRPLLLQGRGERRGEASELTLTLQAEINRRDYGLTWNQALDSGGLLIGNTVKMTLELVLVACAQRPNGEPGEERVRPAVL